MAQNIQMTNGSETEPQLGPVPVQGHPHQELYRIWASDNQVYGPVTEETLITWIADERVFRDSWVYLEHAHQWHRAGKVAALQPHFPIGEDTVLLVNEAEAASGVAVSELRQFDILAALPASQLARMLKFAQLQVALPNEIVIKRHAPGDSFYMVLSGSVRARIYVGGDERTLARIPAGQFFGDLSMFTQTPRSADVVAEQQSRLLRISAEAFRRLMEENPAAASPVLFGLASNMARHIVEDNKRFQLEVASEFVWR
jgi:CRP-like cAMP-binding protein